MFSEHGPKIGRGTIALIMLLSAAAQAQIIESNQSGLWLDPNIWTPTGPPMIDSFVHIGHNVTLQTTETVSSLTLQSSGTLSLTDGQLTLRGGGELAGGTVSATSGSGRLSNLGELIVSQSTLFIGQQPFELLEVANNDLFTISADLTLGTNVRLLNNVHNNTIRITTDSDILASASPGTGYEIARIINAASSIFEKTGGNGVSSVGAVFENAGLVSAKSGTLSFEDGLRFINTGSLHAASGATLQVLGNVSVPEAQSISGGGAFDIPALTVAGNVSPGDSIGTLTTTGDLLLQSTSLTLFEIGGTTAGSQYDVLNIGGDFTPGGQVSIDFVNGFTPTAGQTFDLWQISGAINGVIDPVDVTFVGGLGDLDYRLNYLSNLVQLELLSPVIWSIQHGDWTTGSTWTGGTVPMPVDTAGVQHSVTLQGNPGAVVALDGLIIASGGDLHITDQMTLAVAGQSQLDGGAFGSSADGLLQNQGDMAIAGTVLFDGGQMLNTNLVTLDDGELQMADDAVLTNRSGTPPDPSTAWLRFTSDADITDVSTGGTAPVIVNQGIVEKTGGSGESTIGPRFENHDLVSARSGTLRFTGEFSNAGSLEASTAANLAIANAITVPEGQFIRGGGTFDVPSITVAGDLSPGDPDNAIGTLTITGDLVLESTSHSLFEIGGLTPGAGHDVLHVGGDFTPAPGAQVSIDFVNGFSPAPGNVFTLWQVDGTIHGEISPADVTILDDPGMLFKLKHFDHAIQLGLPRVIQSTQDGQWTAGTTWLGGQAPNPFDTAVVRHEVTLGGSTGDTVNLDALVLQGPDGFLSITNQMTLAVDGESTLNGGNLRTSISGGGTLHNLGVMTVTDETHAIRGHILNSAQFILNGGSYGMTFGSVLTNQSSADPDGKTAVIRFLGDDDIFFSNAPGGGGANPTIVNRGLIEKTGGDGVSEIGVFVELDRSFDGARSGEVHAQTGTIRFTDRIIGSAAHFTADQDANIEIASDFYLSTDVDQTFTYTGGGEGHLQLVTGGLIRGTQLGSSITSPEDQVRAVLDFEPGFFQWVGGGIVQGTTKNIGEINIVGTDAKFVMNRLVNAGVIIHHDNGTLAVDHVGGLTNDTAGVYEFRGDGGWTPGTAGGSDQVINRGLLLKSGGVGTSTLDMAIANSGTIRIASGQMTLLRLLTNSGNLFAQEGTTLRVTQATAVTVPQGATLGGGGTFDIPNLNVAGTITPGDSAGTLTILGNLLFNTGAIYDWEIDGSSHDLIDVQGTLSFGSSAVLNVKRIGSTPAGDGDYVLFQFTGTAPTLPDWTLNLPAGWSSDGVIVRNQTVLLTNLQVPEPATWVLTAASTLTLATRRRR